jgi:hypothetical protein
MEIKKKEKRINPLIVDMVSEQGVRSLLLEKTLAVLA